MTLPRTVADVLSEHVAFEVECIDRMYLNVYVPQLQHAGGLLGYVQRQLGLPIASTAPLARITDRFTAAVHRFAEREQIAWVDFAKGQRKDDVMHEHLAAFQAAGRTEGVVFIGRAQEKTSLFRTEKRRDHEGKSYPWIVKTTGVVNHFYFYCVDSDFGPFFLKFCSYFPYNAKLCLNGNHWAQQQAARGGIGFEALDNGFAAVSDPVALQSICERLGPAQIDALLRKWLARLPHPFTPADRQAGYRYDLSILQAEFSLTQMLDKPISGRVFFEQVIRDNLDAGRPDQVKLDLRPAADAHRPPRHPRTVPHPGDHQRCHPEPARGLQARHDQAVPQGRTGAADRDHHQRHPRLRDRQTADQPARPAGGRLLRQPRLLRLERLSHDPITGADAITAVSTPGLVETRFSPDALVWVAVVFHGTAAWRNHGLIIFRFCFVEHLSSCAVQLPRLVAGSAARPPPGGNSGISSSGTRFAPRVPRAGQG